MISITFPSLEQRCDGKLEISLDSIIHPLIGIHTFTHAESKIYNRKLINNDTSDQVVFAHVNIHKLNFCSSRRNRDLKARSIHRSLNNLQRSFSERLTFCQTRSCIICCVVNLTSVDRRFYRSSLLLLVHSNMNDNCIWREASADNI